MDQNKQSYLLMHKNIPVCSLNISQNGEMTLGGKIIENIKHFPLGGKISDSKFSEWWKNRYIPKNRDGINKALKIAGYSSSGNALVDNLALSLTDCYWIKERGSDLTWEKVNLYQNEFIDEIGEAHFGKSGRIKAKKNIRRVGSSSGELKKKWCIGEENKRILIKGNITKSYQQSLNEVFISNIHKQLNQAPFLQYELTTIKIDNVKTIIGCKSEDFCSDNVEFISASEIIDSRKLKGSDNVFSSFKDGCIELGIKEKDFDDYMDYLIITDYLFTNIDRHLNNIGILRNPDTLEILGFSPIFDSGNSMFYNLSKEELYKIDLQKIKTNSFFRTEQKMLSLVKNKNIVDLSKIQPDFSIYELDIEEEKERYDIIKELFSKKLRMLKVFQQK